VRCYVLMEINIYENIIQNTLNICLDTDSCSCSFRSMYVGHCPLCEEYLNTQIASSADSIDVSTGLALIKLAHRSADFLQHLLETVARIRLDTTGLLVLKSCGLVLNIRRVPSKIPIAVPNIKTI
jgi:hypothetical protein